MPPARYFMFVALVAGLMIIAVKFDNRKTTHLVLNDPVDHPSPAMTLRALMDGNEVKVSAIENLDLYGDDSRATLQKALREMKVSDEQFKEMQFSNYWTSKLRVRMATETK